MTTTENESYRLTRRRALQGAAWTAPAIVVASAAPAFASSPGGALDLIPGGTAAVLTNDGIADYYDLNFLGLSVIVPVAVAAGQLVLTTTYTPSTGGGPNGMATFSPAPTGWVFGGTNTAVTLTYSGAVTAGSEIQVQSGIFIGAELPTALQTGTYVVTATAPSLSSDSASFATPLNARPSKGAKRVPRPRPN